MYRTLYYCDACVPLPFPLILPSHHPSCGSVSASGAQTVCHLCPPLCQPPPIGMLRRLVEEWTLSGGVEAKECVLTVDEKWQEVEADEC